VSDVKGKRERRVKECAHVWQEVEFVHIHASHSLSNAPHLLEADTRQLPRRAISCESVKTYRYRTVLWRFKAQAAPAREVRSGMYSFL
jgi:hypothetical protein